jgi:hypothetical protein
MALINDVKKVCDRLAPLGWRDLLLAHGLDITATDLRQELTKDLPTINRRLPGFEDFAAEGMRGIAAGDPARSLLFHALVSPNVIQGVNGVSLNAFPTLAEQEVIENYVYGIQPPSLGDLKVRAQQATLAIVVFAYEYRPAAETVHRRHADQCFSRTGVARVGTAEPLYSSQSRGFIPTREARDEVNAFHVLPARYAAYIAIQQQGDRTRFGPMRFQATDSSQRFWVPLHKLFNGTECIRDLNLQVTLKSKHVNQKLRRIHLALPNSGWNEPDISNSPFIFTAGITEFSTNPDFGTGLLMPVVHAKLVEAAAYQGKPLTFSVSPGSETLSSSLNIPAATQGARHAPEYVHARHRILEDGREENLNDRVDVEAAVQAGGYEAQHYLDFTGDGWVEAECPALAVAIPRRVPAYSLVTAPDFFGNCDQRELLEWTEQSVPTALRANLWRIKPETLADTRMAPNLQLQGVDFRPEDKTVSAIISPLRNRLGQQMALTGGATQRHAYLPDAAAGVFAPGWDISFDVNAQNVQHLASYGLGSPFPEDAKLCAALSTFWPAAAPDAARTFQPNPIWPTVSPLTDDEIGQTGNLPWDGIPGPRRVVRNGREIVEYADFDHVDYVESALKQQFSLALTNQVDVLEYESRVLSMARVYQALNITPDARGQWSVLSFRRTRSNDPELQQAQTATGALLQGKLYRFEIYRHGSGTVDPTNPRKHLVPIRELVTLFVAPLTILLKRGNGVWQRRNG